MKKTAIIIASTLLFSICLTSCNSDPFASANGSYENVRWDISNAEEVTDKVAVYSLGRDAWEIMSKSKKIVAKSDKLELKPLVDLPSAVSLDGYLTKRHDLDDKNIETVDTAEYINNTSGVFYNKSHLYTIKDEASEYRASRFLVLEQSFMGLPIYRVPYNNTTELIKWDDHVYWINRGLSQYFKADDLIILYDDNSYPWQNAEPVSAEFNPIQSVQGIKTVVNALVDKYGDNCSIRIFSAELCYLMANEWLDNTGTESFLGQDLLCVPVWKYDYSLVDKDGANADMGSLFLRADTGALADLWDDKIVAQIHSPG